MNLDFQLIITTYNRPVQIFGFVNSLLHLLPDVDKIIVIDSSDKINEDLVNLESIIYVQSTHKNQPYQRFLGYQISESPWLIFFDDDMEIIDYQFFEKISERILEKEYVGLGLNFQDKHDQTFLLSLEKSAFKSKNSESSFFNNTIRSFTGYPILEKGKVSWNGLRGKQPSELQSTEWFSGGAFIAKSEFLYRNFNFTLFDLYEKRLGKGEDFIISYTLSKSGKVFFLPDLMLLHNDQQNSVYSNNHFQLAQRVLFSRLFLSLEYARLNNLSFANAKIKFHWYAFWRVIGVFFNYLIKRTSTQKELMKGNFSAWKMAFSFQYKIELSKDNYWTSETKKDISASKHLLKNAK